MTATEEIPAPPAAAPDRARATPPALPTTIARSIDPSEVSELYRLVEEMQGRLRVLEAGLRHADSAWSSRVFLIQPDGGNTLYSESGFSYSGTNPTTVPLSDQTGTICRSFLQNELITPPAGSAGVMQFDNGTTRAYVKLPGGVDLLNQGTNVISATPFINIPTNRGTSNIFAFATATISGTPGANFVFNAGSSNNVGIYWHTSSGTWVIDYAKFHT